MKNMEIIMKQNQNLQISQHETKERIPVWLYPSTLAAIDTAMQQANCKSRSQFLEKAAQMYAGYISADNALAYLPPALAAAIRGSIQDSENRIARLLFKLAVELDMSMNVLAAGMEIDDETLKSLRGRCVQNVKKTGGSISLDSAVKYQNGE